MYGKYRIKDLEISDSGGSIMYTDASGIPAYIEPESGNPAMILFDGTNMVYSDSVAYNGVSIDTNGIYFGGTLTKNTELNIESNSLTFSRTTHDSRLTIGENTTDFELYMLCEYDSLDPGAHKFELTVGKKGVATTFTSITASVHTINMQEGKLYVGPLDATFLSRNYDVQIDGSMSLNTGNFVIGSYTNNGDKLQINGNTSIISGGNTWKIGVDSTRLKISNINQAIATSAISFGAAGDDVYIGAAGKLQLNNSARIYSTADMLIEAATKISMTPADYVLVGSTTNTGSYTFQVHGSQWVDSTFYVNIQPTIHRVAAFNNDVEFTIMSYFGQEMNFLNTSDVGSVKSQSNFNGGAFAQTVDRYYYSIHSLMQINQVGNLELSQESIYSSIIAELDLDLDGTYSTANGTLSMISAITAQINILNNTAIYHNVAGLAIRAPHVTAAITDVNLADYYGIYIQDTTNATNMGGSNIYAIFQEGANDLVHFNGFLMVGTTTANGKLTVNGEISTAAPSGGAGRWKLGVAATGSVSASGDYVNIEINGVPYKIQLMN